MDFGGSSKPGEKQANAVSGDEAGAIDQREYDEELLRAAIAELHAGKLHFAPKGVGGEVGDDSATQVAIANGYLGAPQNGPFGAAGGAGVYDPNG